jgi:SNF2 family DNA or RNA helicase
MTSLSRALSPHFGTSVRRRGVDYYHGGRVTIKTGSAFRVAAAVHGSERYEVDLQREHDEVRASCSCPHFETNLCKHIWACVLAADARQFLQGDGRGGSVRLAYDDPVDGGDDHELESGAEPLFDRPASGFPRASPKSAAKARKGPPGWRAQLDRVRLAEPQSISQPEWPGDRELLYVVDAAATLGGRGVYVEVWSHDAKKDGTRSNRSKIQVLEALLRLRQAAIHPGLLDSKRAGEPSAKLDVLLPRLQELHDEGHKTLVFSQFTGMLGVVRARLDGTGVSYEYLDGQTKNREARVVRFQNDLACRLFLVSLKAGGVGLNLTGAQYVFLLDPWWNPAVEAQAIDRAHRIGQSQHVFACRLIARDTIEEKVLELQDGKRALADAILGADNALIRTLRKEDLELLLS